MITSLAYHLMLSQIPGIRRISRPPSRDALADFRNRAVVRMVKHAYENVEYYRRLFQQHGISPADVRGVEDLGKLPLTSRAALQSEPIDCVLARGSSPSRLERRRTSGSTGAPLTIFRSRSEDLKLTLYRWRALSQLGWKPVDRVAAISTATHTVIGGFPGAVRALACRFGLARRTTVDTLLPLEEIVASLARVNPDLIIGYAGTLAMVAGLLTDEDRERIHPRVVLSGAEVLTPAMKEQVGRGFRAPVREYYGSHEFVVVGWECVQTGGFHLCDDSLVVEILRDGKPVEPGEQGEVVITGLHNYAMPFIRYQQGDVAVRAAAVCPCGQPFSTIKRIEGRMLDWFILPGGRWLHPYEIVTAIRDVPWLRRFQLIQLTEDLIQVKVVPFSAVKGEELARVRNLVLAEVGTGVRVDVMPVEDISLERTGKFRVAYSMLASSYARASGEKISPAVQEPLR